MLVGLRLRDTGYDSLRWTGHTNALAANRHRIGLQDAPTCPECEGKQETMTHLLIDCQLLLQLLQLQLLLFVLFLRAGVNYMLVGLRLRDTRYDSLRFDSQSKATGYNSLRFGGLSLTCSSNVLAHQAASLVMICCRPDSIRFAVR